MIERREHVRFFMNGECVIRHLGFAGNIIDISIGGVSCTCIDQEEMQTGLTTKLDICCIGDRFCIEGLQVDILNTELIKGKFSHSLGIRKCRAKFSIIKGLKVDQLYKIITSLTKK